ncbi:SRPBCC family protein [Actinomadura namibiensis]
MLKETLKRIFGGGKAKPTNIVEYVDVGAPRRLVYDQFTRFQEFPSFMKKVQSVDQVADERLHWKAKIFWSARTWESTIVEQVPDRHITWRSKGPKGHVNGTVSFHELTPDLTRVLLNLEYHPKGLFERTGNLWRAQGRRVRLELKHFRRHVMTRSLLKADEIEGWRGEIRDSEVVRAPDEAPARERTSSVPAG